MAGGADIAAGRAFIALFLKDDFSKAFASSLRNAQKNLATAGANIANAGGKMIAATAAVLGPAAAAITHFVSTGSQLNDMAERTGVAAGALAELKYAAEQTGASAEDLESGIKKSSKAVTEAAGGNEKFIALFGEMGLSVEKLKAMSPEEQFQAIGKAMAGIPDSSVRSAVAMELFGKSGTKLIPMMKELQSLRDRAKSLGVMSDEDAKNADAMGDAFGDLMAVVAGVGNSIATALLPVVRQFVDYAIEVGSGIRAWISNNQELIVTIVKVAAGIAIAGGALVAIGTILMGASAAIGAFFAILATVKALIVGVGAVIAALFSPIGLVVAAVIAAVAAFLYFTETGQAVVQAIKDIAAECMKFATEVIGGIVNALKSGDIALAGEIAMAALYVVFQAGLSKLKGLWIDFKFGLYEIWESITAKMSEIWNNITGFIGKKILGILVKLRIVDAGALAEFDNIEKQDADSRAKARSDRMVERNEEYERQIAAANKPLDEARKKLADLNQKAEEQANAQEAFQEDASAGSSFDEWARKENAKNAADSKVTGASIFTTGAAFLASSKFSGGVSKKTTDDVVNALKKMNQDQAKRDKEQLDATKKIGVLQP